jgi:transposase
VHKSEFPLELTQPVQYGENMQALMNYLTQYQLIPLERTAEAVKDIPDQAVSEGTLVNAAARLYSRLEEPEGEIKQQVIDHVFNHQIPCPCVATCYPCFQFSSTLEYEF